MLKEGRLVQWDDAKGYGFIEAEGGRWFVHVSSIKRISASWPAVGDGVVFQPGHDEQGRPRALAATVQKPQRTERTLAPEEPETTEVVAPKTWRDIAPADVISALGLLWLPWRLAHTEGARYVLLGYALASLVTFFVYGFDKRKAVFGGYRVSERTLHTLALAGGWPGAWAAQYVFRHKLRKPWFRFYFIVTVLANLGGLYSYGRWIV